MSTPPCKYCCGWGPVLTGCSSKCRAWPRAAIINTGLGALVCIWFVVFLMAPPCPFPNLRAVLACAIAASFSIFDFRFIGIDEVSQWYPQRFRQVVGITDPQLLYCSQVRAWPVGCPYHDKSRKLSPARQCTQLACRSRRNPRGTR